MLRTLGKVSGFLAVCMIVWRLLDGSQIYAQAAKQSDVASGKTVPISGHGLTKFITSEQARRLGLLNRENAALVVFIFFSIAALLKTKAPDTW